MTIDSKTIFSATHHTKQLHIHQPVMHMAILSQLFRQHGAIFKDHLGTCARLTTLRNKQPWELSASTTYVYIAT